MFGTASRLHLCNQLRGERLSSDRLHFKEIAMSKKTRKSVIGVFRDRSNAEKVYDELKLQGFGDDRIHVLMSDRTRHTYYPTDDEQENHPVGSHAVEGMGIGGAVGTAVGAALGAVAIGTLAIPGIGIIIAGPLAAAIAGAGAGAITGGLVGALVGYGIPEANAQAYEAALNEGGIVLGVEPRTDKEARDVKKIFEESEGDNVYST